MDKIIVVIFSAALLSTAFFTLAHGGATHRTALDRNWQDQQKCQRGLDRKIDKIQKDAEESVSAVCNPSVQFTGRKGRK
jgi:hypothetical protein